MANIPLALEQIKPNQKGDQLSKSEDFRSNIWRQSLEGSAGPEHFRFAGGRPKFVVLCGLCFWLH
jgi:hypothetical protein